MSCVLITGCSSGIGLEAAMAFAGQGRQVLAGVRRSESLAVVAERCEGLSVEPVLLDVTDRASIDQVVAATVERFGPVEVLVNNAGIGSMGALEDTPEHVYRAVFETNVFGTIAMCQAVLPHMRAVGSGTIVNVGSIVGRVAVPFQPIYTATKHAVGALTDALDLEVSSFGIRVRVVEPGRIPTAFGSNLISERAGADSPYRPLLRQWEQGWGSLPGRENLAPASEVARIIVQATEPDAPRHLPAGEDSEKLIAKREELDLVDFEQYLRQVTNYES